MQFNIRHFPHKTFCYILLTYNTEPTEQEQIYEGWNFNSGN